MDIIKVYKDKIAYKNVKLKNQKLIKYTNIKY